MIILGVDTATAAASVALVEDGKLIAEEIQSNSRESSTGTAAHPRGNHAEIVLPLIQSMLTEARVAVADLSGIAVSIGPGSFTGLRVGLATAKGIAYECGLPLVGVSTLHANAARVPNFHGMICSLLDARKNEVYFALFRHDGQDLKRLTEDAMSSIDGALDQLRDAKQASDCALFFIGDGARTYEKFIARHFAASAQIFAADGNSSVAAHVARLAEERFRAHSTDDLALLAPVYLRPTLAETKRIEDAVTC
jgi:tRNA threonylcarbamoyladenosine biosynthesis protein TsaB